MGSILRIAILTGNDSLPICESIGAMLSLPNVQVVAILRDIATPNRRANLKRNLKREGWSYLPYRTFIAFRDWLEGRSASVIPRGEADELIMRALPEKAGRLADVAVAHGLPLVEVDNLNSPRAAEQLRSLNVDLGVVLGTRILRQSTFSVPRLGCVNLHKGKVPEYRGMPPGFWELYDGASSAGVTVHWINAGLDTGDILGTDSVAIHPNDNPRTLGRKLDACGTELLRRIVSDIADGKVKGQQQVRLDVKPRTLPTRKERAELYNRLGYADSRLRGRYVIKLLAYVVLYHSGIWRLIRGLRNLLGSDRAAVLLYHRVNDDCDDALTTSCRRFAEHLVLLRERYHVISTQQLVEHIANHRKLPPNTVVIHFDDCYKDVYQHAGPLLAATGLPACSFVSSGFVDSSARFPHDASCPFVLANLSAEDVRGFRKLGIEVGAHTVTHADLGKCSEETMHREIAGSKRDLERILGESVSVFSYPFGGVRNTQSCVLQFAKEAGFSAMFSAHGGTASSKCDLFDIPRLDVNEKFGGLELLMLIEGFSVRSRRNG